MIQFSEASIKSLIVHRVGNSVNGDGVSLSNRVIGSISDDLKAAALMHYLLSPFKGDCFFNFTHPSDLSLNTVYDCCDSIFNGGDFRATSHRLASHLYESSDHPNIKSGELYVVLFKDIIVESEVCDAVGIFKSESKETFLKVQQLEDGLDVGTESGINVNNLDKGCLVFQTERDFGFKVCAIDNTNRSSEAVYWKEAFLRIKPRDDSYYQTRSYMDMCKGFVKDVFNEENNVEAADQASMLYETASFFKGNEVFNEEEFHAVILQQPEIIEEFKNYKEKYETLNQVTLKNDFSIATDVATKMQKHFKNVLKLDKNFHIYLHGDRSRVEKGFDQERNMSYYKLYFETENL